MSSRISLSRWASASDRLSLSRLRPYQREVASAILDSVFGGKGLTFSVEMARQGGKNELSAQIELLLLTLYMTQPQNLIKCSPTFKPQTVISMMRLKDRLNDAGFNGIWTPELGFKLLAAINSGRLKSYAQDGSDECGEFWKELERAKCQYRPSQTLNFYVSASEGHDDYLMSLALLVEAAERYEPRGAKGRVRG